MKDFFILTEERRARSRHGIGDSLRKRVKSERDLVEKLYAINDVIFQLVRKGLLAAESQAHD